MEKKITPQLVEKLMAIKGEARGATLLYDWEFILETKGEDSLKKIEARMAELGYPVEYSEIKKKKMAFYPIGLDALSVLVIKELFNFNEQELMELGAAGIKLSLFLKILVKYFASLDTLVKGVPKMWRDHYTIGELEVVSANKKEKRAVIRLKDFVVHKAFCFVLKGFFSKAMSMVLGVPVVCRETKCVFDGDAYHEFMLEWGERIEKKSFQGLTESLVKNIMAVKGEARGVVFKTDEAFILAEKGKPGLEKVQKELKKMGHFMEYEKIKTMNFYPIGLRTLSLIAMQRALGFSEDDIERMGSKAPKASLIIKLFGKFFFSITKMAEQAPKIWAKHYTAGNLAAEAHEQERYAIIRLGSLDLHPLFCVYLKGYFSTIIQMIVNASVTPEELRCSFKGGKQGYHEFLFKW